MGQRMGLASTDLIKLNRMYKCNGHNTAPSTRPQHGQNNYNNYGAAQGNGFVGTNWGYYPQQAASFLRQLVSYFFQRNPRQGDDYNTNSQNDGYGFSRGQSNGYGFNGQNDRNGFNGPYGGYGFQK